MLVLDGATSASEVIALGLGYDSGCAITMDQSLHCWGSGEAGAVADGDTSTHNVTTPLKVSGFSPSKAKHLIKSTVP